jgi:hypothetical protein
MAMRIIALSHIAEERLLLAKVISFLILGILDRHRALFLLQIVHEQ